MKCKNCGKKIRAKTNTDVVLTNNPWVHLENPFKDGQNWKNIGSEYCSKAFSDDRKAEPSKQLVAKEFL